MSKIKAKWCEDDVVQPDILPVIASTYTASTTNSTVTPVEVTTIPVTLDGTTNILTVSGLYDVANTTDSCVITILENDIEIAGFSNSTNNALTANDFSYTVALSTTGSANYKLQIASSTASIEVGVTNVSMIISKGN